MPKGVTRSVRSSLPSWGRLIGMCGLAVLLSASNVAGEVSGDDALIEKLEKTKISVEYAPEDLVKVIEALRTQHGLNVQVAWNVLDSSGVRKDKRIEVRLKDVPLTVLLDNVVREIDPEGSIGLGWGVEHGVIVIAKVQALGKHAILKAYDVRDLLESGYAIRRFAVTPALTLETTGLEWVGGDEKASAGGGGGGGFGGGGGGGGNVFGEPGETPTSMEKAQQLIDLLTEQIAPDSWTTGVGLIHERNGVLYVRQTLQNQQEIRSVLDLVRSMQPAPLHVDVAIVRLSPQRAAALRAQAGDRFPIISSEVANEIAFTADIEGVMFRSTIGGRNGEAAWISDVTQKDALVGQRAVVAQSSSAITPVVGRVHQGLEVIALPQVDLETSMALVDVQMAWKPSTEIEKAKEGVAIDRTQQRMRTVASQTRCKLGEALALTIPASPADNGASIAHDDWLIVRVRGAGR